MLHVYAREANQLVKSTLEVGHSMPSTAVWVDLVEPTTTEEKLVETSLGIEAPTREEMQEIELSSRLYEEGGVVYVTATVIVHAETPHPESTNITFILTPRHLVTLRYAEPLPFTTFATRAQRLPSLCTSAEGTLVGLLEAIADRLADILEKIGSDLDRVSNDIFDRQPGADLKPVLARIGRSGELATKTRESVLSLVRILAFLSQTAESRFPKDQRVHLKSLATDLQALGDHASFLSSRVNFLLDATLGMLNIEQNATIKIFSVAAVVFLPPTLIASVYGMNFEFMPELHAPYGYPAALLAMVLSAIGPYIFFKRKGWL